MELKELPDALLKDWCQGGKIPDNVMIIDIREPIEFNSEHIIGSHNIPASKISTTDFSPYKDKIAVFHCSSGIRTKRAADAILATGFKEIYCLPQGIQQWKACQLPVQTNTRIGIDIMRQVQITAGSLVVIGLLLGYFITPSFMLLSFFVGAGLIYAGISGNCYMAQLLTLMPWNKK